MVRVRVPWGCRDSHPETTSSPEIARDTASLPARHCGASRGASTATDVKSHHRPQRCSLTGDVAGDGDSDQDPGIAIRVRLF